MEKNTKFRLRYPVIRYEDKNFELKDLSPHLQEFVKAFMKDGELTEKEEELVYDKYNLSDILDYFKISHLRLENEIELTQFLK